MEDPTDASLLGIKIDRLLYIIDHSILEPTDACISPEFVNWMVQDARQTLGLCARTYPHLFYLSHGTGPTPESERRYPSRWDNLMDSMWEYHEGRQKSPFPPGFAERYNSEQL
jgi:hypothetical protein